MKTAHTRPRRRSHQPTLIPSESTLEIILHGPHEHARGSVVAFCNALERAIGQDGEPVNLERWHIGAARGDDLNTGGVLAGLKALLSSLPQLWRTARVGTVLHLNTSFTRKALLRDAIYFRFARWRGARIITQFHGGSPSVNRDRLSQWAIRTLCGADAIVVINDIQRDELLERAPKLERKIELISNGVNVPALELAELTRSRLEHPRLLFLSRLDPRKGAFEAIQALEILHRQGLPLELDIAGDGPALEDAKALARTLELERAVTFHGMVGGETKARLFKNASLLLFPSSLPEGQPMVILEAFAWALPVVSSNTGTPATLVPDGVNGLQVSPNDPHMMAGAITQLLRDPVSYRLIARTNRQRADGEFDVRRTGKQFLELYRRVL